MKKRFWAFAVLICVVLFSLPVSATEYRFTDVPVKIWYHDAVYFCAERNIMVGTGGDLFSPNEEVTRGMFATILGRSAGVEEEFYRKTVFSDTSAAAWYGPYVAWAAEKGIVSGYEDGLFRPEISISREEMMSMFFRYATYCGDDVSTDRNLLKNFEDYGNLSDWAEKAAAWCVGNDYISGMTETTLSPKTTLTRAQVSKVMTVRISGKPYVASFRPVPGEKTLKNFLNTALEPVGTTLYVYGGGWNKEDTGAGEEACTIGLDPRWKGFFESQDASYDYNNYRYYLGYGLDCSGYVGWTLYNTVETKNGQPGYVMSSTKMARDFSDRGWGTLTEVNDVNDYRAGDIMSTAGHVWICIGQCNDGSVVLLHSSPPGVVLTGTVTLSGKRDSEAVKLAATYTKKYFPRWYQRYPDNSRGITYLTEYEQMRWSLDGTGLLTDPHGYASMPPKEILEDLLGY